MSDELLNYYNKELQFLRRQGAEFAQLHPKIASRLRIDNELIEDPHVERLIQSVAFLNARIRHKLDDDFPEVAEAILAAAFPQYLRPVPSMSIVQCRLQQSQAELVQGFQIPTGAPVETDPIQGEGEPVRFQTTSPVQLWPVTISDVSFHHFPFDGPREMSGEKVASGLKISLGTLMKSVSLSQMKLHSLRLWLSGSSPLRLALYEMLMRNRLGVAVRNTGEKIWKEYSPAALKPVGFDPADAVLPRDSRSFPGYWLLTEFFVFPEKFLFIDLELPEGWTNNLGPDAEILIPFDTEAPDLESFVTPETLRLGCVPVINLFTQTAEAIRLSGSTSEYRVVPDARRPLSNEVYSINRVTASSNRQTREYVPMYSSEHGRLSPGEPEFLWHSTRRVRQAQENAVDPGTEIYLSLVDQDYQTSAPNDWTLKVETTCLNRDRPRLLPFGGGQPRLHFADGHAGIATVHCVTRPTHTHRPKLGHGVRWRLVSHLTLHGLSLNDLDEGADGLREILKLYDFVGTPQSHGNIDGLIGVKTSRTVGRIREEIHGRSHEFFCRGVRIDLLFDETEFSGGGLFLFASVLESFLASYCSVNAFVETTLNTKQRGEIYRWPKRSGNQPLI